MEKIIWWWNMVYYFCVKWYTKVGDIVTYPLYKLFNTSVLRKWSYKKRGVEYDEKIVKNAVKQAQIAETYMRLFLGAILFIPLFAIVIVANALLIKYGNYTENTFVYCGIALSAYVAIVLLQNYLLGKDDRYKEYFKEFDQKFKKSNGQKRLYAFLCILTLVTLASFFVLGFHISDNILH